MSEQGEFDWDPRSETVQADQINAYDEMRRRCPVARSRHGYASVFRHADVLRLALDHDTFSSAVSRFPAVPNGMDPPEHTEFRALIDRYFSDAEVDAFLPACRRLSQQLLDTLPEGETIDFMATFSRYFAMEVTCAYLGWPEHLHEPLMAWTRKNYRATLKRDEKALSAVALEFDGYITALLEERRQAGEQAPNDATTRLLHERIFDRPLTDTEIVSILRNWTVGELATIAACVGILVEYLAGHPDLQRQLREQPALLPPAIDEILRIHPPLIMNRRVATKATEVSGVPIAANERLALLWASANRDEAVFGDPDEFRLDRDPALNLLYGAGIHYCPGAYLSREQLRVVMTVLLEGTQNIRPAPDEKPTFASYPGSGFSTLPLQLVKK
ncbi:MAG: cytochrome P450 [Castellaniella sp.]